ncbi:MAG: hypothetical protein DCE92_01985 [Alphaproteobacteria bacterium]|nr:MAG: hypothetical protein DCE92_01985 [Alphaproteobacteria bacterium]
MEKAALRFSNCLGSQKRHVWCGTSYFYELVGLAVVEFERVADLGWEIIQASGPRNEPMTWETYTILQRELSKAPGHMSTIVPQFGECFP